MQFRVSGRQGCSEKGRGNLSVFDLNTCSRENLNKVLFLLKTDTVFISCYNKETKTHDDGCYPVIFCNDVFGPGSDAENLQEEDIDLYTEVVKKYDWLGATAFVGIKRGMEPWDKRDEAFMKKYSAMVEILKQMGVK